MAPRLSPLVIQATPGDGSGSPTWTPGTGADASTAAEIGGTYGLLKLQAPNASGVAAWTYELDNDCGGTAGIQGITADPTENNDPGCATEALNGTESPTPMDAFTIRVDDGTAGSALRYSPSLSLAIAVTGANDRPAFGLTPADPAVTEAGVDASNMAVAGDSSAAGSLTAMDPDEGDTASLKYQLLAANGAWQDGTATGRERSGTYGSFSLMDDGAWTYALNNDSAATNALDITSMNIADAFSVRVEDAAGLASVAQMVSITVNGTNDAPEVGVAIGPQRAFKGAAFTFSVPDNAFTDPEGDTPTYTLTNNGGATWLRLSTAGQFSVLNADNTTTVPDSETAGATYNVVVTGGDGKGGMTAAAAFVLTIDDGNQPPVPQLDSIAATEAAVTGSGTTTITGNVVDGTLTTRTGVSDTLVADTDPETDTISVTRFAVGNDITASPENAGGSVTATVMGINATMTMAASGAFTFTPLTTGTATMNSLAAGEAVPFVFTYEIDDDDSRARTTLPTTQLSITVIGENDAPTADAPDNCSQDGMAELCLDEEATHAFAAAHFGFNDADTVPPSAANTLHSVTITALPNSSHGTLALSGTAHSANTPIPVSDLSNLVYTPANQAADYRPTITYTVSDGTASSDPETLNILVTADDDAPTVMVATGADTIVTEAGGVANGTAGDPTALSGMMVSDPEGATLGSGLTVMGCLGASCTPDTTGTGTGSTSAAPITGTYGVLRLQASNGWTYELDNECGSTNGIQTVSVDAAEANDPGCATERLTPAAGGMETFRFLVNDGTSDSAVATQTITVTGANDAPVPTAAPSQTVVAGGQFTSTAFAAFTDADGDIPIYTAPNVTHTPEGGSPGNAMARPAWLNFNALTRVFSGMAPATGANGAWTVPVIGTDGGDSTVTVNATTPFVLTVTAAAANMEPEANDDSFGISSDHTRTVTLSGNVITGVAGTGLTTEGGATDIMLGADSDDGGVSNLRVTLINSGDTYEEDEAQSVTSSGTTLTFSASQGSLTINDMGAFTYTPPTGDFMFQYGVFPNRVSRVLNPGESNTIRATYRIADMASPAETADGVLTITVTAPPAANTPPTLRAAASPDITVTEDAAANDTAGGSFTVTDAEQTGANAVTVQRCVDAVAGTACTTFANAAAGNIGGIYGNFTLTNAGVWEYTLDNQCGTTPGIQGTTADAGEAGDPGCATDALAGAATASDVLRLRADDGTADATTAAGSGTSRYSRTEVVTITITGANDAPTVVATGNRPAVAPGTSGAAYSQPLAGFFEDVDTGEQATLTYALSGTCTGFEVSGDNLVGSGASGNIPSTVTTNTTCMVTATDVNNATSPAASLAIDITAPAPTTPTINFKANSFPTSLTHGDDVTFAFTRTGDTSAALNVGYRVDRGTVAAPVFFYRTLPAFEATKDELEITLDWDTDNIGASAGNNLVVTILSSDDSALSFTDPPPGEYTVGTPNKMTVAIPAAPAANVPPVAVADPISIGADDTPLAVTARDMGVLANDTDDGGNAPLEVVGFHQTFNATDAYTPGSLVTDAGSAAGIAFLGMSDPDLAFGTKVADFKLNVKGTYTLSLVDSVFDHLGAGETELFYVRYRIEDEGGLVNLASNGLITITVTAPAPAKTKPTAVADSFGISSDHTRTVTLSGNVITGVAGTGLTTEGGATDIMLGADSDDGGVSNLRVTLINSGDTYEEDEAQSVTSSGTTLTFSASQGSLTINDMGAFTYTPPTGDFMFQYGVFPNRVSRVLNPGESNTIRATYRIADMASPAETADGVLTITVTAPAANTVPTVATAIPDRTATVGGDFSLDISSNFSDVDMDTLTYSATYTLAGGAATAVPAPGSGTFWLKLDRTTGVFSGMPMASDITTSLSVTVTASDGHTPTPGTVPDTFTLTVVAAPVVTITNFPSSILVGEVFEVTLERTGPTTERLRVAFRYQVGSLDYNEEFNFGVGKSSATRGFGNTHAVLGNTYIVTVLDPTAGGAPSGLGVYTVGTGDELMQSVTVTAPPNTPPRLAEVMTPMPDKEVTEDAAANDTAGGSFTVTDAEQTSAVTVQRCVDAVAGTACTTFANAATGNIGGIYGNFTLTNAGAWTYTLDNQCGTTPGIQGTTADAGEAGDPGCATDALAANVMVTDVLRIRADDGTADATTAAGSGTSRYSATEVVTVTITGANDRPVPVDDPIAIDADDASVAVTARDMGVLANDTDDGDATKLVVTNFEQALSATGVYEGLSATTAGSALRVNFLGTTTPDLTNGQKVADFTLNMNGTYTLALVDSVFDHLGAGETELFYVLYVIRDEEMAVNASRDEGLITITVNGAAAPNTPPVAANDLVEITTADLRANDTYVYNVLTGIHGDGMVDPNNPAAGADSDGDAADMLVVTRVAPGSTLGSTPVQVPADGTSFGRTGSASGQLSVLSGGSFTYQPTDPAAAVAGDVYTYEISDGTDVATATFTIRIALPAALSVISIVDTVSTPFPSVVMSDASAPMVTFARTEPHTDKLIVSWLLDIDVGAMTPVISPERATFQPGMGTVQVTLIRPTSSHAGKTWGVTIVPPDHDQAHSNAGMYTVAAGAAGTRTIMVTAPPAANTKPEAVADAYTISSDIDAANSGTRRVVFTAGNVITGDPNNANAGADMDDGGASNLRVTFYAGGEDVAAAITNDEQATAAATFNTNLNASVANVISAGEPPRMRMQMQTNGDFRLIMPADDSRYEGLSAGSTEVEKFSYRIADMASPAETADGVLTITVTAPPDDTPRMELVPDDTSTANVNETYTVTATNVTVNFRRVAGTHGSVDSTNEASATLTPQAGFYLSNAAVVATIAANDEHWQRHHPPHHRQRAECGHFGHLADNQHCSHFWHHHRVHCPSRRRPLYSHGGFRALLPASRRDTCRHC